MLFTVKNVFPCSSLSCCFFRILFYILVSATFSLHSDSLFVCFQSCLLLSGGNIEDWRCLLILVLNLTRIIFQRCKRKCWSSQITTKVTSILCITSTCFSCCCHPAWNCVRLNSSYAKQTGQVCCCYFELCASHWLFCQIHLNGKQPADVFYLHGQSWSPLIHIQQLW